MLEILKDVKFKDSANYLVSEKIYERFSKHAKVYQVDENTFEREFINNQIKEAIDEEIKALDKEKDL